MCAHESTFVCTKGRSCLNVYVCLCVCVCVCVCVFCTCPRASVSLPEREHGSVKVLLPGGGRTKQSMGKHSKEKNVVDTCEGKSVTRTDEGHLSQISEVRWDQSEGLSGGKGL
mmetsp:Transcript_3555/g.7366  ORF Transcript_3555/g.7366 Transcript_3555/m.7366 type:complete len:113 (+) Transcript_3555:891-1229(+)